MQNLIIYLTEVSLCLTLFYLFYCFLLQQQSSLQWNRGFLLMGLLASICLPLLQVSIGGEIAREEANWRYVLQTISIEAEANQQLSANVGLVDILLIVYFTGVLLFGMRFLGQLWSFRHFIRQHSISISEKGYYIVESQQLPTFSFFKYLVVNTQQLSATEKKQVLLHEETHIEQQHSYDRILLEVLKVLFWFNPIVYLYQRKMQEVHEFLADSVVLQHYPNEWKKYAQLIVQQAIHCNVIPISNHFSKHQIKKRILMMKNTQTHGQKRAIWLYFLSLPLLGLSFLLFSCSDSSVEAQTPISEVVKKNMNEDEVYQEVDQMPEYPGGFEALVNFLGENLKYPKSAKEEGVEGKSLIGFVIDKEGKVTNARVTQGFHPDCDAEALRVIKALPDWSPGKHEGKTVKVELVLPIMFKMEDNGE